MRLHGKVAVITGSAGGIGRATALRFAQEGAAVVAADMLDEANEQTALSARAAGGRAISTHVDVTSSESVADMIAVAEHEFGRVDILFNNAGVMLAGDDDAISTDEDTIDRTLAINVKGVIFGCKHGIPAMRRAGGGSIINTASFVASIGAATPQVAYTASKGAVLSLTRELAVVHRA